MTLTQCEDMDGRKWVELESTTIGAGILDRKRRHDHDNSNETEGEVGWPATVTRSRLWPRVSQQLGARCCC